MSRNKNVDYTQFVHEITDEKGNIRYAVAKWDEKAGQYSRPLDARTKELTGCQWEHCRDLWYWGGYKTRAKALRRARYLFGESNHDQNG